MITIGSTNNYQSPFGPINLQQTVKGKIEQQQNDSFSSKAVKTAKKAGSTALTIGALAASCIALYKNKGKIFTFIKNIPNFMTNHKQAASDVIIDVPCKVLN